MMIASNPLTLTYEERALIAAFRQCDARGRYMTLWCAQDQAEESPKPRPRLSLVTTHPTPAEAPNDKR